jgi:ABC-type branched-subunit amino acid transport system substrate-binding protein
LRINQWNESEAQPKIELVALNDDGDPALAARLPAQLAQDPDIRIILGPPQGHTAMAALTSLAETGIPTMLLAPVRSDPGDTVLTYAGLGGHYQKLFQPLLGILPLAWSRPVSQPVIWLGDPLTLAELVNQHPELIPAAGPVAGEVAFQHWASELAWSIPWAAPIPAGLPASFASDYEKMTGEKPTPAAALAYAATDEALRIIAAAPNHRPGPDLLRTIPLPDIVLVNAHLMQ